LILNRFPSLPFHQKGEGARGNREREVKGKEGVMKDREGA